MDQRKDKADGTAVRAADVCPLVKRVHLIRVGFLYKSLTHISSTPKQRGLEASPYV